MVAGSISKWRGDEAIGRCAIGRLVEAIGEEAREPLSRFATAPLLTNRGAEVES